VNAIFLPQPFQDFHGMGKPVSVLASGVETGVSVLCWLEGKKTTNDWGQEIYWVADKAVRMF
jgi:hypothetical protein